MAAKQPSAKNLTVFNSGTPRALVLAEFGLPTVSEVNKEGNKVDIFKFTQGYSGGAKAARAIGHGVADVLTLGLWEVIGTPVESVADGNEMAYQITYDKDDKVALAIPLKKPD